MATANRFKAPSNVFTDRSKAVLLLWFTISVIACLCMYILVKNFLLDSRLANYFGKNLPFWLSACSVLTVVPFFKCVLLSLSCIERMVLGNCNDS